MCWFAAISGVHGHLVYMGVHVEFSMVARAIISIIKMHAWYTHVIIDNAHTCSWIIVVLVCCLRDQSTLVLSAGPHLELLTSVMCSLWLHPPPPPLPGLEAVAGDLHEFSLARRMGKDQQNCINGVFVVPVDTSTGKSSSPSSAQFCGWTAAHPSSFRASAGPPRCCSGRSTLSATETWRPCRPTGLS